MCLGSNSPGGFKEIGLTIHQFMSKFGHFLFHFSHFGVETLPNRGEFGINDTEVTQFDWNIFLAGHYKSLKFVLFIKNSQKKSIKFIRLAVRHTGHEQICTCSNGDFWFKTRRLHSVWLLYERGKRTVKLSAMFEWIFG